MRAEVSGSIRFSSRDCPPKVLERLRRDLSFPNPEYITRRRLKKSVRGIEERIECLVEDELGGVEIPRGAVGILKQRVTEADIAVSFEDHRVRLPGCGFKADIALRDYQQEAVRRMCAGVQGVVVAPCGSGKSVIAADVIAAIDQPTLIIVHTHDLLEQWRELIQGILEVEPGIVAQKRCQPAAITVAMVQTLVKRRNLGDLSDQFGCVIVDEAHHAPVSTFQQVVSKLAGRYRFGLTATPYREDGMTRLIEWTFGNRLFEVDQQHLVQEQFLLKPEVRVVSTEFSFTAETYNHNDCMAALVLDSARNDLIADLAAREAAHGHSVLILSNRSGHCRQLAERLHVREVEAQVLIGTMRKSDRSRVLSAFRAGELPAVVATTLADEGMDVRRLSRVILAYPSRAKGRTIQRLGRLMRPHPGKQDALLYDLVDEQVPQLKRQFQARRQFYRSLGIEPVVVANLSEPGSRPKGQDSGHSNATD